MLTITRFKAINIDHRGRLKSNQPSIHETQDIPFASQGVAGARQHSQRCPESTGQLIASLVASAVTPDWDHVASRSRRPDETDRHLAPSPSAARQLGEDDALRDYDTAWGPAPTRVSKARRITVIGCGHVGLVMAAGFAKLGHDVTGLDRSPDLIRSLNAGQVPFHEVGLPELVEDSLDSKRLTFTTSYAEAVPRAEFIFLAVDTPGTLAGAADLRNIRAAASDIALALNGTSPIIVNKSTSPIGTGETIEGILRRDLEEAHTQPRIVSNPEFLRQGLAVHDFFHPDRVVIGARSEVDARAVAELYEGLGGEVLLTSLRTAEMIKYVANSFLATRISFINEIAHLCEALNVDIDSVVEGIGHDPRIGTHFFKPGIGFGGSCLPKDIAALRYMGEALGVSTPMMSAVQQVNIRQRTSAVRRLRAALGGNLDGKTIAVWGVTFKGNTEDTRESPAVDVIELLLNEGANVRLYDPSAPERLPERLRNAMCVDPLEATRGADALAVLADWPEFRQIPLDQVRHTMSGDVLFDGKNTMDAHEVAAHGLNYIGVGRGAIQPALAMAVAR